MKFEDATEQKNFLAMIENYLTKLHSEEVGGCIWILTFQDGTSEHLVAKMRVTTELLLGALRLAEQGIATRGTHEYRHSKE